ncbi:cell wall synthase accessory phosphoprotein MacP, partial [Streptococcus suis]|uniref:cell wall synthase accessory phosphoprotein MacP n=1 Tax=Streptococcus suis TaxID=1307 RepID=UPI00192DB9C4
RYDALFDPYLEEDYQGYEEGQTIRIPVKPTVVKSRRIETIKREAFRSKVNKILFWVIILLIMFIIAVLFI